MDITTFLLDIDDSLHKVMRQIITFSVFLSRLHLVITTLLLFIGSEFLLPRLVFVKRWIHCQ